MRHYFWLLFTMILLLPTNVFADEMITIRLVNYVEDTNELTVKVKGEYTTFDSSFSLEEGKNYTFKVKERMLVIESEGTSYQIEGSVAFIPKKYDTEHIMVIDDRPYLGAMEFIIEKGHFIRPVNQLLLEDYLKGVVPFEVYPTWELETLKAQTLAARTYAITNLHRNMDDTISYQVYGGYTWEEKTSRAVEGTAGEVITYNNRPIDAFYSASNGGLTERNDHVWGGEKLSYFPIKEDPYDPINPWEFRLHQTQIQLENINWDHPNVWDELKELDEPITDSIKRSLHKKGYVGDIKVVAIPKFNVELHSPVTDRAEEGTISIEFLHRLVDGTILYEVVDLEKGNINRIRPMIGGNTFKSYLIDSFELKEGVYYLKGRGFGHGVGMSQWGAEIMGESGKSYKDIIDFYYPGTEIKKFSELR
ncbi:modulator protein [Sutcliffiella cohnii]|uniref:Modulator protein n=1 Tax=Sutcliffiella cohnii TaxID=33932 RepID=A0A223KSE5_9BACI|nr:SpoIID/LytB domain-containing protein [Sutcliffiella cohnii]AST92389.1 modulator protein [Sutcliffiella cohnii]